VILIITDRVVVSHLSGPCRKVANFLGVKATAELPREYLGSFPRIELGNSTAVITVYDKGGDYFVLRVGDEVTETVFQTLLTSMRSASDRLERINRDRRELAAVWSGEEIFYL